MREDGVLEECDGAAETYAHTFIPSYGAGWLYRIWGTGGGTVTFYVL